jgi:hypothetical protein
MGEFVCGELSVADAREYDEYSATGARVMQELVAKGRLPEAETVQDFIHVTRRYVSQLRSQADAAAAGGATTFVGRFALSAQEYRMLKEMGGSLSTVIEIMMMRGTVDLTPPLSATTFGEAMAAGHYVED